MLGLSRSKSRSSPCGSTAPSVAACGSSTSGEPCREATVSPGALALSLALAISELIVLLAVVAMRRTTRWVPT